MKTVQYSGCWIWLILYCCNIGSILAVTQCGGTYTSNGYQMPGGTPTLDSTSGTGFLNDYSIDCCGIITSWEVYAGESGDIELQVWRPDSGGTFQLIGENLHTIALPSSGCSASSASSACFETISIPIPVNEQISVTGVDRLGWRAASNEIVGYVFHGLYKEVLLKSLNMPDRSVGEVNSFSDGATSHQRYGFLAYLSQGDAPSISGLPASIAITDSASVGTSLFTPSASDVNTMDTLTFSEVGTVSGYFLVNNVTGEVTVGTALSVGIYNVDIMVADPCELNATGTLSINVTLAFPLIEIYNLPNSTSVSEDTTSAMTLHTFSTNDPGAGTITCSMSSGVPFDVQTTGTPTVFTIDLLANPNLDYASQSVYLLNVTCTDGVSSETTNFTVNVLEVINQAPQFTNIPGIISLSAKTTGASISVYNVTASDAENDTLTFTMSCSSCPFIMWSDGSVLTTTSLLAETVSSYTLSVYVADTETTVGPSNLTIYLTDLNTSPYFSNLPASVSVSELTPTGTSIFSVTGNDNDIVDTVTITLPSITPVAGGVMFSFNATDGTVSLSSSAIIDYEYLSDHNYTASFSISDGIVSVISQLNIYIINENEAPAFLASIYYLSSVEGQKDTYVGDPVFAITDQDIGDSHVYTITGGQNSSMVSMNTSTGQIYFAADWDILPANSPLTTQLNVLVTDSGGLTDSAVLELTITHVNQPPTFLNLPQTIYVLEDITSGTTVYSISATDVDGDTVSITLTNTDAFVTSVWEVQGTSVTLKSSVQLDYETIQFYVLTFTAFDGIAMSTEESLNVTVQDTNEPPTFSQAIYYMSASEGLTGDALPAPTYSASDVSTNDVITYSIVAGTYSSYFSINSTTGNLYYTIDYIRSHISGNTVNLTIRATDQYGAYNDAEVQLTISYTNVKPTITNLPGNVTIAESTTTGSWIFTVTMDDSNNDDLDYRVQFSPTSAHSTFSISQTGYSLSISTNESLNFEMVPVYSLTFTANDGTVDSDAGDLQIYINDVSEPPEFSSSEYYTTVNEDVNGTLVFNTLVTTDEDAGDTLSYSVLSGSHSEYFSISTTGAVYFNTDYDYDNPNFPNPASIVIKATDSTGLTATTTLNITVNDVNDNSPVFDSGDYVMSIDETSSVGAIVLTTTVTDSDSGINSAVQYSLSGSNPVPDLFAISNSGEIILKQSVSAYLGQSFNFSITVEDQGSPSLSDNATVTIIIAETTTSSSASSATDNDQSAIIALGVVSGLALASAIGSLAFLGRKRFCPGKSAGSAASESADAVADGKKNAKDSTERVKKDTKTDRRLTRSRTRDSERSLLQSRQSNSSTSTTSSTFEFWNNRGEFDISNPGGRSSPLSVASLSDVDVSPSSPRFQSPIHGRFTSYSGHA